MVSAGAGSSPRECSHHYVQLVQNHPGTVCREKKPQPSSLTRQPLTSVSLPSHPTPAPRPPSWDLFQMHPQKPVLAVEPSEVASLPVELP